MSITSLKMGADYTLLAQAHMEADDSVSLDFDAFEALRHTNDGFPEIQLFELMVQGHAGHRRRVAALVGQADPALGVYLVYYYLFLAAMADEDWLLDLAQRGIVCPRAWEHFIRDVERLHGGARSQLQLPVDLPPTESARIALIKVRSLIHIHAIEVPAPAASIATSLIQTDVIRWLSIYRSYCF